MHNLRQVFRTRLFCETDLLKNLQLQTSVAQTHFIFNVLRLKVGAKVLVFNAHSGEWVAEIVHLSKKEGLLSIKNCIRQPVKEQGPWLAIPLIKKSRTDFIIEKGTELGVEKFIPIYTNFTGPRRVSRDRLSAIAREASEQCGRLSVPSVEDLIPFQELIGVLQKKYLLFYGDETGKGTTLKGFLEKKNT